MVERDRVSAAGDQATEGRRLRGFLIDMERPRVVLAGVLQHLVLVDHDFVTDKLLPLDEVLEVDSSHGLIQPGLMLRATPSSGHFDWASRWTQSACRGRLRARRRGRGAA